MRLSRRYDIPVSPRQTSPYAFPHPEPDRYLNILYPRQVLHMDGVGQIMKHRIDNDQLEKLLKAWRPDPPQPPSSS